MSNPPANVAELGLIRALRKRNIARNATSASGPMATSNISSRRAISLHYLDDPYIETKIERGPMEVDTSVLVIGGGFSGPRAGRD